MKKEQGKMSSLLMPNVKGKLLKGGKVLYVIYIYL